MSVAQNRNVPSKPRNPRVEMDALEEAIGRSEHGVVVLDVQTARHLLAGYLTAYRLVARVQESYATRDEIDDFIGE